MGGAGADTTTSTVVLSAGRDLSLNGNIYSYYDLMDETGIVMVHGSGFCEEFGKGHFRTILLPPMETLEEAYGILEKFMLRHQ